MQENLSSVYTAVLPSNTCFTGGNLIMFKNFYADEYFDIITDISPDFLKKKGIKGINGV